MSVRLFSLLNLNFRAGYKFKSRMCRGIVGDVEQWKRFSLNNLSRAKNMKVQEVGKLGSWREKERALESRLLHCKTVYRVAAVSETQKKVNTQYERKNLPLLRLFSL